MFVLLVYEGPGKTTITEYRDMLGYSKGLITVSILPQLFPPFLKGEILDLLTEICLATNFAQFIISWKWSNWLWHWEETTVKQIRNYTLVIWKHFSLQLLNHTKVFIIMSINVKLRRDSGNIWYLVGWWGQGNVYSLRGKVGNWKIISAISKVFIWEEDKEQKLW